MSVGCLMITTNLPSRLHQTMAAIHSVDEADHSGIANQPGSGRLLDKKVLSIDLQPGVEGCEDELRRFSELTGWKVIQAPCTGHRAMIYNILRGLSALGDVDRLFYCEDHIIVERLPTREDLWYVMDREMIGWINFNTHIHQENLLGIEEFVEPPEREKKLAYINALRSADGMPHWYRAPSRDEYLIKETCIGDEYYLNFPAAIATRKVFASLLEYGMTHYSGIGIEIGFTRAWFDTGMDKQAQVAVYTKPGTVDKRPFTTFGEFHQQACIRFRNNDPTMLHDSIVAHSTIPQNKNQQRSFF